MIYIGNNMKTRVKQEIAAKHNGFVKKMKLLIKKSKQLRISAEVALEQAETEWNTAHRNKDVSAKLKNEALSKYDRMTNLVNDIRGYCNKLETITGTVRLTIDVNMQIDPSVKSFNMAMRKAFRDQIIRGQINAYSQPGPYEAPDIKDLDSQLKALRDRFNTAN